MKVHYLLGKFRASVRAYSMATQVTMGGLSGGNSLQTHSAKNSNLARAEIIIFPTALS